MKKILAIVLLVAMTLSLAACNSVSKTPVAILWRDGDTAITPDSLINAMERAMYIQNVSYKHYGAEGDSSKQLQQVQQALDSGASALMVELIDPAAAQSVVDMAKAKNIPLVFFGCEVEENIVTSYEKCVLVTSDAQSKDTALRDLIGKYLTASSKEFMVFGNPVYKTLEATDIDGDGKISYVTVGQIDLPENPVLARDPKGEPLTEKDESYTKAIEMVKLETTGDMTFAEKEVEGGFLSDPVTYRYLQTADGKAIEMLLVADDQQAITVLQALQELDMNASKLATNFIPVFTVGADADYKAYVMASLPAGAEARKAYLNDIALLVDMTALSEDEWKKWEKGEKSEVDSMVFNTLRQIDTGRITGTVTEDQDALAAAAAKLVATLLKGRSVSEPVTLIPYTTYGG